MYPSPSPFLSNRQIFWRWSACLNPSRLIDSPDTGLVNGQSRFSKKEALALLTGLVVGLIPCETSPTGQFGPVQTSMVSDICKWFFSWFIFFFNVLIYALWLRLILYIHYYFYLSICDVSLNLLVPFPIDGLLSTCVMIYLWYHVQLLQLLVFWGENIIN